MSATETLAQRLQTTYPQWVIATHAFRDEYTVILKREGLVEACQFLRDDPAMDFNVLMDVTAVDLSAMGTAALGEIFRPIPAVDPSVLWVDFTEEARAEGPHNIFGEASPRFEVVYHLYSIRLQHRLRLKVPVEESDPSLDSVTSIWKGANWFEREAWDLFGIMFRHHPHLKRILLYEGFTGHPLRKDYPVNRRQPLVGPLN